VAGLLDRLQTFLFGAAIGRAASDSIGPVLEPVHQHAWQKNQVKVLDPATAAAARAKGILDETTAEDDASRSGIGIDRFGVLLRLAQSYPGLADLNKMSNRTLIDPPDVEEALTRHGIPDKFHKPITEIFNEILSLADIAAGIQQGHLPNPDGPDGKPILPNISPAVTPPGGALVPEAPDGQPPSSVPLTQIDIDPIKEAAGQGFDVDRLRVRANLSGLPPGPAELLTMWNRNEITEEAVDAGLREGHLKTKWSGAFKRMRWAVLGAAEYAGLHLRGWITEEEMNLGGALTGHTPDQMQKLYLNRGRPLAPVQAFTAWARGAPHPKGTGYTDRPGTFDEEDFLKALKQSDVRTEYGPILWHNRFAYPPLFQLGRLAQAGALTRDRVQTILRYERYEEEDVQALLDFWYGGTAAAKADPWLTKAEGQWWTAAHKAFVKSGVQRSVIEPVLELLVPDLANRDAIFQWWTDERAVDAGAVPGA
jgi:hypothetical protein